MMNHSACNAKLCKSFHLAWFMYRYIVITVTELQRFPPSESHMLPGRCSRVLEASGPWGADPGSRLSGLMQVHDTIGCTVWGVSSHAHAITQHEL
jgi:hypothetical protein